jgi:lipopolysaccharide export system permease protein
MILARYLGAQLFPPFLFGLSLFSGVLLLDKVFDLLDLLINKGVSLLLSLKMFLLFLPTVVALSLPMSLLLACLLTFGRLSEDNEITALRASGFSFLQLLWAPLGLATLSALILVPFNTVLAPRAVSGFQNLYHEIVTTDPLLTIEPRQLTIFKDIHLYAQDVTKEKNALRNVWLYQTFPDATQRIFAREGQAHMNEHQFSLQLKNGQIERFSTGKPRDLLHIQFKNYTFTTPLPHSESMRGKRRREMTFSDLRQEIRTLREKGVSTGIVETELHLRFSMAFAPIALALLGIPLGMTLERGGRGVGFGAAIGVLFLYYLLLIMGINLAERDVLDAFPAVWIANVTTVLIGGVLYYRRLYR